MNASSCITIEPSYTAMLGSRKFWATYRGWRKLILLKFSIGTIQNVTLCRVWCYIEGRYYILRFHCRSIYWLWEVSQVTQRKNDLIFHYVLLYLAKTFPFMCFIRAIISISLFGCDKLSQNTFQVLSFLKSSPTKPLKTETVSLISWNDFLKKLKKLTIVKSRTLLDSLKHRCSLQNTISCCGFMENF